jgi:L-rhamnose mutarotase
MQHTKVETIKINKTDIMQPKTIKLGYRKDRSDKPFKRYCQMLTLKNDTELINEYKFWHRDENRWTEIPTGIREIGILDMEIYLYDFHVFMIVETPMDFDWDTAFGKLASLEKQAEWEAFMSRFQNVESNKSSSEKWVLMERIFSL